MSWFLVILFLVVTFGTFSEASSHHHHKKPTSAVVVGTVYCDTCFQQDFSMGNHIISGASVEVECKDEQEISKPRFKKQVKTNEHGEFRIQLPFSISKHVKRIKGCVVKLVSSNEPYCSIASTATSSSIHLKSRKQGLHIFSAGFFSFKPLKQPNLCNQKPSIQNTKKLLDSLRRRNSFPPRIDPSFPPPLQDPNTHNGILPPIPLLPEIITPILPPILSPLVPSGTTNDESKSTKTSKNVESLDEKKVINVDSFNIPPNPFFPPPLVPNNPLQPSPLVPNPLQPPSTPLVPNPFQPPTTPTIPNPFQPPPSRSSPPPLFPFPSVPGLSPSTPPSLGFPFPPLFPSPGTPPASSKNGFP